MVSQFVSEFTDDDRTHLLETIHQTSIRTEFQFFHDVFEVDKIFNIYCRLIIELSRGRIEVDIMHCPFHGLSMCDKGGAEG
jgi:hypothetical protein